MGRQIKVRATAILVEDEKILLVEQRVTGSRSWSLPGGALEAGETLEACLVREVREETGLLVGMDRLLYLCDRIEAARHVVHITFQVRRLGGHLQAGEEPEPGANPIHSVEMVPLSRLGDPAWGGMLGDPAWGGMLRERGFSQRFCDLAESGFPGSGTCRGAVSNIGL